MKIIKLTLLLLLFSVFAFAQSNCEKFKTGKFQNVENGLMKSQIERNDSIQVEQHGEIVLKLKIVWINDCSYRLKFLEGNKAYWDLFGKDHSNDDLIVKITEVKEDSYTQESRFEGIDNFIYKSNIVKIEEM